MLASHVDYDIRSLCSRVFLIEKGRLQMEVYVMEGWKKWYIVIAIVFIVTAIAGKIIRTQAPDTGLAEVDQLEDLLSLPVELEYALGDNGSKDVVVKDLTQNQEVMSVRQKRQISLC